MELTAPEMKQSWAEGCIQLGPLADEQILGMRADARRLFAESHLDDQPKYLAGRPDGSFATPSRARFAYASEALDTVHRSAEVLDQVRAIVRSASIAPSRAAFTYYTPGSYLGIHRDVQACTVTLLIAFTANLGPLYFAPSKRGFDNAALKEWVDQVGPYPVPEASIQLPTDRFLAIDGRTLPHWRGVHDGQQTGAIASLCYFDTAAGSAS